MNFLFKNIKIFVDENKKLIGIPSTVDNKWKMDIEIEPAKILSPPYSVVDVEIFINEIFSLCHNRIIEDYTVEKGVPIIQKYTKSKSWKGAVKKLGLIYLNWTKDEGYTISLTWQNSKARNAFDFISSKYNIKIPENYKNEELGEAFLKALDKVAIGPQEKNPYI